MYDLREESSSKCWGGYQKVYSHFSKELNCRMNFGIYLPEFLLNSNNKEKAPVLYYLSGLTCTEQNFIIKSGFQRYASELKLIVVNPDTSPRGCNIEGEDTDWDFGTGAGFYVDSLTEKFKNNYRMYSYVTKELIQLVEDNFGDFIIKGCRAISGHSMGGHGALISALKNPGLFKCAAAFAPISNPINCLWGKKCFSGYLGEENKNLWANYDASELVAKYKGPDLKIRIDQGADDPYLNDQLKVDNFVKACQKSNVPINYYLHEGFDHGYFFVSTFIPDHFSHISKILYSKN
ncbi:hypothetical protein RND71_044248 [Anisodus tanguticus]|uniref:S-formylglutathione hydrolase n=1 Tax=Anisodus tanguticus TaxID=243964 RepID=A0AAE1UMS7_9SOLA|nr:hypothetical protein RND71_044248 [Anisodus tanguticus]